jgi:hypothetical protein
VDKNVSRGRSLSTVLSSETKFILQKELKIFLAQEFFFQSTATGNQIITKVQSTAKPYNSSSLRGAPNTSHFAQRWRNLLKLISGIHLAILLQRALLVLQELDYDVMRVKLINARCSTPERTSAHISLLSSLVL